jgi:hypothetical protein
MRGRLIPNIKYALAWTLVALIVALLTYCTIVSIANAAEPDRGVVLIASIQDGDVNVYRLTHRRFNNCLVTVGELHGKTVTMVCN